MRPGTGAVALRTGVLVRRLSRTKSVLGVVRAVGTDVPLTRVVQVVRGLLGPEEPIEAASSLERVHIDVAREVLADQPHVRLDSRPCLLPLGIYRDEHAIVSDDVLAVLEIRVHERCDLSERLCADLGVVAVEPTNSVHDVLARIQQDLFVRELPEVIRIPALHCELSPSGDCVSIKLKRRRLPDVLAFIVTECDGVNRFDHARLKSRTSVQRVCRLLLRRSDAFLLFRLTNCSLTLRFRRGDVSRQLVTLFAVFNVLSKCKPTHLCLPIFPYAAQPALPMPPIIPPKPCPIRWKDVGPTHASAMFENVWKRFQKPLSAFCFAACCA